MDLIEAADVSPRHRHPWELARLWVLRHLIARRVRIDAQSTVVDIGCGDAFVIGELARLLPEARFCGIDAAFTPETAAARERTLPSNVRLYQTLDAVPPGGAAALILLMDVLEHIQDDGAFLANVLERSWVGPETQFIVTVPAYQALFSAHDVFLKHFRRYTNRQLRDRLEQAGLRVTDIGYFFASLLPLRILTVIKERLSPAAAVDATGLSEYGGGGATTAVLSAVLKADAFAALLLGRIGISVPGLSNYAICRTSA